MLAADPGELVLARVLGAAIGLGLIRRQEPMRLLFNIASFAIETEALLILVNLVHGPVSRSDATNPIMWLWVLLFMSVASLLGFAFTALAISLAEGRQSRRPWLQPIVMVLIGGFANCSIGLAVVAIYANKPWELLLLLTPLAAIAASYVLYTREHEKHERLQYLYESSDMLQRRELRRRCDPRPARPLLQGVPRGHRGGVVAASCDRNRIVAHDQHVTRSARCGRHRAERRIPGAAAAAAR